MVDLSKTCILFFSSVVWLICNIERLACGFTLFLRVCRVVPCAPTNAMVLAESEHRPCLHNANKQLVFIFFIHDLIRATEYYIETSIEQAHGVPGSLLLSTSFPKHRFIRLVTSLNLPRQCDYCTSIQVSMDWHPSMIFVRETTYTLPHLKLLRDKTTHLYARPVSRNAFNHVRAMRSFSHREMCRIGVNPLGNR